MELLDAGPATREENTFMTPATPAGMQVA